MIHWLKCPFCDTLYVWDDTQHSPNGAVLTVTTLSIECACGATYALTRGGRPRLERPTADGN